MSLHATYIEWNSLVHFLIDGIVTISPLTLVIYQCIFHIVVLFEAYHSSGRI
jgi:hypothetical protein